MKNFIYCLIVLFLFSCSSEESDIVQLSTDELDTTLTQSNSLGGKTLSTTTKTIVKVSKQSGSGNYQKLVNAIKKANSNNVIELDVDVTFWAANKAIIISKPGVTIVGSSKSNGKYKLTRAGTFKSKVNTLNSLFVVKSNNVLIENIQFVHNKSKAYRSIFLGDANGTSGSITSRSTLYKNITITTCDFKQQDGDTTRGIFFEGSFQNVSIQSCSFNNWFSLVARDCPTLDGFIVNKCVFNKGSHQISFDGALLGETDPTYNIGANLVKHKNIRVTNCKFNKTKSFNLAIANTRNVYVFNNTFWGGTNAYSQGVHIEDNSRNIRIVNNRINNNTSTGILVYSTDKVGHGQGRRYTDDEKKKKGSGNVLIKNNTINTKGTGVQVTYLTGYVRFEGTNKITTGNGVAVNVARSNEGAKLYLKGNDLLFNGKKRDKAISDKVIKSDIAITKE